MARSTVSVCHGRDVREYLAGRHRQDISSWTRPQHDGAPLRVLAVLRWVHEAQFDADLGTDLAELVCADLAFTSRRWHEPSFDIWEEELGLHYYTLRVSAAALEAGG